MSQKPAYTDEEVVAAGLQLRAQGIEPDRCTLYNKLGRRGLANTSWTTWIRHRDQSPPANLNISPIGEERSEEIKRSINSHSRSLSTIIECVRKEARAPLVRQVEALDKALAEIVADRNDLQALVEILQEEKTALVQEIGRANASADQPRLILPGRY